jgi:hypothetical protein
MHPENGEDSNWKNEEKHNFIVEHFPKYTTDQKIMSKLFIELIPNNQHLPLQNAWMKILSKYFKKLNCSVFCLVKNLISNIHWPPPHCSPPNLIHIIQLLVKEKKFIVLKLSNLQKSPGYCILEILKLVCQSEKEQNLINNFSKQDHYLRMNFLVKNQFDLNINYLDESPSSNSLFNSLGNIGKSFFKILSSYSQETYDGLPKSGPISLDDLQDEQSVLVHVDMLRNLLKKSAQMSSSIFFVWKFFPKNIFIKKLKNNLNLKCDESANLILIWSQINKFFHWKNVNEKLIIHHKSFILSHEEIDLINVIENIQFNFKQTQNKIQTLNCIFDEVICFNELILKFENSNQVDRKQIREIESRKMKKKSKFKNEIINLNSIMRDFVRSCQKYNQIYSQFSSRSNSHLTHRNIFTSQSQNSYEDIRDSLENAQVHVLPNIFAPDHSDCKQSKIRSFVKEHNSLVKNYFGRVEKIFCYNKKFNFGYFIKIVDWLKGIFRFKDISLQSGIFNREEHFLLLDTLVNCCKVKRNIMDESKSDFNDSVSEVDQ